VLIDLISLVVKDYKMYLIVRSNRQRDTSELLESASSQSKMLIGTKELKKTINTVTCSLERFPPKLGTRVSPSKVDKIVHRRKRAKAPERRVNSASGG
jgi:hypothetical protein